MLQNKILKIQCAHEAERYYKQKYTSENITTDKECRSSFLNWGENAASLVEICLSCKNFFKQKSPERDSSCLNLEVNSLRRPTA